ncbi:Fe-S cluster assembly protein SufB [Candidatus Riesia pediculicola]|uniref:FeS assembly protein SufB n=1 Tax=Riesia pediculicola (strain USDA) TaxID=515618 RepID=D4G7U7_RIEPU|nr:Fe-S cluster assembly protein SufB [Candidatus Riesia pediculicola]ADD79588.1 FeS assembly protein SufB [Candidatus Riesia pediculicola USDA]ARC53665.1 cysteine desulfurase [Candidatus Riesia pediculicola]QOJ86313.1 Fe-S cluster assembly protein SufB [Candidatus Riesia pediculicola]
MSTYKKGKSFSISEEKYRLGFSTPVLSDKTNLGINEKIIYQISKKRKEPDWMLNFRLESYKKWLKMKEPHWLNGYYPKINYQKYFYYSSPIQKRDNPNSGILKKSFKNQNTLRDNKKYNLLNQEIQKTFEKFGISFKKKSTIAVDAVFDSVSVFTTHRKDLEDLGIIFCSFNQAIRKYPELVKKYLGSVVPNDDNFFASLNSAVASDGTFVYVPKYTKCPIELSTYFRINEKNTGQFERTILVADKGSELSYLEGCSAPIRKNYQLHAAVVEVIVHEDAKVKYSTIQNWFPGKIGEKNGILNFVTKRALCKGKNSNMSWIQSEIGSAITWKYPSVILKGDNSVGEFYSISLTNGDQQADTGTKMIHIGKNTSSTIISKGIACGKSINSYRGLVKILEKSDFSRNYTQCDSLLVGKKSSSHAFPLITVKNRTAQLEHEATTSKISEEQIFYCSQRGINQENAVSMIVNGFCRDVFFRFPLEFSAEAQELLKTNLERII